MLCRDGGAAKGSDEELAAQSRQAHVARLTGDRAVRRLGEHLVAKGLTPEQFDYLLGCAAEIPPVWLRLYKLETRDERDKRRAKMFEKARRFAAELEQDPELCDLRVFDHKSVIDGNSARLIQEFNDRPTLSEYLVGAVESEFCTYTPRLERRISLPNFAVAELFGFLEDWFPWMKLTDPEQARRLDGGTRSRTEFYRVPIKRGAVSIDGLVGKAEYHAFHAARPRYPNQEVAIITSALVGRTITPQRVSEIRKNGRRHYDPS